MAKYKLWTKRFRDERAESAVLPETTLEGALSRYDERKFFLSLPKVVGQGGGWIQLFENDEKYPLKAERVAGI